MAGAMFFNYSLTIFKIGYLHMFALLTSNTALTILAHVILLLCQCDPNLIMLPRRTPSLCNLVHHIGPYQKPESAFVQLPASTAFLKQLVKFYLNI